MPERVQPGCMYCQAPMSADAVGRGARFCSEEHKESYELRERLGLKPEADKAELQGTAARVEEKEIKESEVAGTGQCLLCGKPLPFLVRMRQGQFCSSHHEKEYEQKQAVGVLSRVKDFRRKGGGTRMCAERSVRIRSKETAGEQGGAVRRGIEVRLWEAEWTAQRPAEVRLVRGVPDSRARRLGRTRELEGEPWAKAAWGGREVLQAATWQEREGSEPAGPLEVERTRGRRLGLFEKRAWRLGLMPGAAERPGGARSVESAWRPMSETCHANWRPAFLSDLKKQTETRIGETVEPRPGPLHWAMPDRAEWRGAVETGQLEWFAAASVPVLVSVDGLARSGRRRVCPLGEGAWGTGSMPGRAGRLERADGWLRWGLGRSASGVLAPAAGEGSEQEWKNAPREEAFAAWRIESKPHVLGEAQIINGKAGGRFETTSMGPGVRGESGRGAWSVTGGCGGARAPEWMWNCGEPRLPKPRVSGIDMPGPRRWSLAEEGEFLRWSVAAKPRHVEMVAACGPRRRLEKRPAALLPGWRPEPWKASRAKQVLERLRLPGLQLRMPAFELRASRENRRINHVREFGVERSER